MDLIKSLGITGVTVLVVFYLVRDVLGPLVKSVTRRGKEVRQVAGGGEENRVAVLELNLSSLELKVNDFGKLLEESGISIDNKLDLVLDEMKQLRTESRQMSERITRVETHIEHLLQKTGGKRGI